tara:strand:+ start:7129 stop:8949 length:1821 start_codon:yes stop_codon:yes gene_type:complete
MAIKQLNITELDFDKIKDEIKSYYKRADGPFKDFDFDGSGLNVLLDILAHNTHYNAVLAHLAANETFISSAQLRKNVVARAKTLGYTPKSNSAPAVVLKMTGLNAAITSLPEGTTFTSSDTLNNETYNFVAFENTLVAEGTEFTVYQGAIKTKEYIFDDKITNLKFEIPDTNVDRTKVVISVSDSISSSQKEIYTQFSELPGLDGASAVYFINENPNGKFDISFGDGTVGKKPLPGSLISIKYLTTDASAANGLSVFTTSDSLFDSVSKPTITASAASSGGGSKESIESIRANAPLQFISQNRAVTIDDYTALVKANSTAEAVSVWGGEDNDPPEYGKVFISAKPALSNTLSDDEKARLIPILDSKGILTVRPKFVDPDFTYLYFNVFANYNSSLTDLSSSGISSLIKTSLSNFSDLFLESFEGVFRYSQFLNYIIDLDPSILSSFARLYCLKKFNALSANNATYKLNYNFQLEKPADPTQSSITSSGYVYDNVTYFLKDEDSTTANVRNIYRYYLNADGVEIIDERNVGTVNCSTGIIEINDFNITGDTEISIFARPASNDIAPKRNQILEIDIFNTTIESTVDTIATRGTAGANEYVTTPRENY